MIVIFMLTIKLQWMYARLHRMIWSILYADYSLTNKESYNYRSFSTINHKIACGFNEASNRNKLLTTTYKYFLKQKDNEKELADSI